MIENKSEKALAIHTSCFDAEFLAYSKELAIMVIYVLNHPLLP